MGSLEFRVYGDSEFHFLSPTSTFLALGSNTAVTPKLKADFLSSQKPLAAS